MLGSLLRCAGRVQGRQRRAGAELCDARAVPRQLGVTGRTKPAPNSTACGFCVQRQYNCAALGEWQGTNASNLGAGNATCVPESRRARCGEPLHLKAPRGRIQK